MQQSSIVGSLVLGSSGPRVLGSSGPRSSGPGSSVYSHPERKDFTRWHKNHLNNLATHHSLHAVGHYNNHLITTISPLSPTAVNHLLQLANTKYTQSQKESNDVEGTTAGHTKQHPPPNFGPISCIGSKFTRMSAHPGASFVSAFVEFEKHSLKCYI